jgi:predicted O-methyltransferase YrrM
MIGLIDASIAIKVGGNLAGKYKNRIGAFHPHSGVIMDFHFLKTLSHQHIRNGIAELIKISTVEEPRCFEILENHCEDLLKFKFGYLEVAEDGSKCPEGLHAVGRELCRKAVLRMLQLECPNLHEHDQRRAIAYGHTWSPCYELAQSPPMHHGHAIAVDMCFSLTWAENLGYVDSALKERVFDVFRRLGLSVMHPWFTDKALKYGTDTIMARRDGDLYAAIPDGEVGKCRYVMIHDFHTGPQNKSGKEVSWEEARAAMDASLEEARLAHQAYADRVEGDKYGNGVGVGVEPNITFGHARRESCSDYCVCSKLELGTWAERLSEMCIEIEQSQTFENVREKVQGIARWWDMCGEYMQNHSSPLGETALKILEEQQKDGVFPEGMTIDWALDMQSAQTLDFLAALKANSKTEGQSVVAWDLGTLTGVSASVLASHFDKVDTVERNEHLAGFAAKQLQKNVTVHESEINTWLEAQKEAGNQADMIFMDLDKTAYEPLYQMIMDWNLLKPGGLLVADNVLYRGLPAEIASGVDLQDKYRSKEGSELISQKTAMNAEALVRFNALVKSDVKAGSVRSLMLPVRDGMMAVVNLSQARPPPVS